MDRPPLRETALPRPPPIAHLELPVTGSAPRFLRRAGWLQYPFSKSWLLRDRLEIQFQPPGMTFAPEAVLSKMADCLGFEWPSSQMTGLRTWPNPIYQTVSKAERTVEKVVSHKKVTAPTCL